MGAEVVKEDVGALEAAPAADAWVLPALHSWEQLVEGEHRLPIMVEARCSIDRMARKIVDAVAMA